MLRAEILATFEIFYPTQILALKKSLPNRLNTIIFPHRTHPYIYLQSYHYQTLLSLKPKADNLLQAHLTLQIEHLH